jgi:hypothetical protein
MKSRYRGRPRIARGFWSDWRRLVDLSSRRRPRDRDGAKNWEKVEEAIFTEGDSGPWVSALVESAPSEEALAFIGTWVESRVSDIGLDATNAEIARWPVSDKVKIAILRGSYYHLQKLTQLDSAELGWATEPW